MGEIGRVDLVPLAELPGALEPILEWNLQVWGERIPGYDRAGWRAFYERSLASDYSRYDGASELVWAVLADEQLVGSIALVHEDDLPDFTHLSPWLAAFVIDPQVRNRGIGRRVMQRFESRVREFGLDRLYLWTDAHERWYLDQGYAVVERGSLASIELSVMSKRL